MESRPAPLLRRAASFAVDYAILALYIALLTGVSLMLPEQAVERAFATPLSGQLIGILTLTLPVAIYFVAFEASPIAATPGKRALGLRVIRLGGGRLGVGRSVGRTALKLLPWELAHTALWRIEGWPTDPEPVTGWQLGVLITVWVLLTLYAACLAFTLPRRTLYDLASGSAVVRSAA